MKNQIELKILVSNPYNTNIEKRLKQVEDFSERDELENHWKTIYENIKQLRDDFPKYHLWGIRFHNQPLYFRFIMTDEKVYFGFYTNNLVRYQRCTVIRINQLCMVVSVLFLSGVGKCETFFS